jgi:hypothetical protein
LLLALSLILLMSLTLENHGTFSETITFMLIYNLLFFV